MSLPYERKLITRAKELRKNATAQENHLWYDFLKDYKIRFQRQKTINNFIVDFYCHKAKLIIELDGYHHFDNQGRAYDAERDGILASYGVKILRFSNALIDNEFEAVCEMIDREVMQRIMDYN